MPDIDIYTRALCGYCAAARKLLQKKGADFNEIDVTMNQELRREMVERSGRKTVPQIFIDGRHIGGYNDINALDRQGRLDELLAP